MTGFPASTTAAVPLSASTCALVISDGSLGVREATVAEALDDASADGSDVALLAIVGGFARCCVPTL
jgi:hypothetical protein